MSGHAIAVFLIAAVVGDAVLVVGVVIAAMVGCALADCIGYTYRKARPGWVAQLPDRVLYHYTTTEALTAMVDTTTRTITMKGRRSVHQPGVLGRRVLFFYDEHTSSGIKLNHREPHLCNGAVVAIRGADLADHTAGARFYRRRWDSAVGVRADYQGSYEGIARNISIAETKQNPLPPTLS
jgi:hypothetical protein